MTLSTDGLILVAEEGGHVVVKRDKRNSRWLLINAIGYAFDGVVIETVALFGYCAPDDFAGDNLVVPDEDVDGLVAALKDALVEVDVRP
jgi:hypothetical protein